MWFFNFKKKQNGIDALAELDGETKKNIMELCDLSEQINSIDFEQVVKDLFHTDKPHKVDGEIT